MTTPFTAEEEMQFKDLGFQQERSYQRDWIDKKLPISTRHAEWLQEQQRKKQAGQQYAGPPSQSPTAESPKTCSTSGSQEDQAVSPEEYVISDQGVSRGRRDTSSSGGSSSSSMEKQKQILPSSNVLQIQDGRLQIQMWSKKGEGWKPLFAMLDSGTEENWVHPKIVRRFGFPVKKGLAIIYITCSGHRMPSEATVKATWSVEGSGQTNDNIFRVAPEEAPFEVLLGKNLQESEEIGFYSKGKAIQVLVAEKETEQERKERERREIEVAQKRKVLMQQPKEVKPKNSSTRKHHTSQSEEKRKAGSHTGSK